MPRLVLVSLEVEASPEALPLGSASVAAAVAEALGTRAGGGVAPFLLDEVLPAGEGAARALAARVLEARPDWLGLSVYAWNRSAMAALARRCREALPGLLLFAGGPEATADPAGLLADLPLDFAVRGEGESATVAALRAVLEASAAGQQADLAARLAATPGICLPGRPAAARAPAEDLSILASPWLSGILAPKEGGVLWELARGCPYRCSYCYEGRGERGIRRVPRERVEAELDFFVRSGVGQVFVLDPTFDADRAAAKSLLDLLGRKGRGIHWKFEVRAELLDRELAAKFACLSSSLQVGLQSADPEVSEACGRPLDLKAFARGLGHLNEAGVVFGVDLIYGLPKDSLAGFRRSLDYALGFQPNHLDLFRLALLPGTELAERATELGLEADHEAPWLLRSAPGFPAADLARAEALARACDLFYCRGRAVSWFLQVLRPLGTKASAFLARFSEYPGVEGAGDLPAGSRRIEELQLAFLESQCGAKGLQILLPAIRDLVRFNGAWGRAIAEGESSTVELAYDPEEVLGPAALDLGRFVRSARPKAGRWRIVPGAAGPAMSRLR